MTMPPLTDRMFHAAGVAMRGLHGEEAVQAIYDAFAEFAPALSTLAPSAAANVTDETVDRMFEELGMTPDDERSDTGPSITRQDMHDALTAAIASPSAEAAQPVAWMWPDAFERLMRGDSPRETAHAATSTPDSVPLYALSQPQGELREALDALHFVSKDPAYSVLRNTTRGFVDAALAGRTAG